MSVNAEMLKGSTIVLVLSMLDREPMYGYQMIKGIEDRQVLQLQGRNPLSYSSL